MKSPSCRIVLSKFAAAWTGITACADGAAAAAATAMPNVVASCCHVSGKERRRGSETDRRPLEDTVASQADNEALRTH